MANTLEGKLESEKDSEALKTESSLDGHKATLANELPPELLVHIFEMAQSWAIIPCLEPPKKIQKFKNSGVQQLKRKILV